MIPLIHDFKGKKVLIFGGGKVGFRKASFFYPEAEVIVVSRAFCDEFFGSGITTRKQDLKLLSDDGIKCLINGCYVVVAATSDSGLNNRIKRICSKENILFNNASGDCGDIIIPSVINGKNYQIAISTGGKSPGMSRYIREYLESHCPLIDEMIDIQMDTRGYLKKAEPDQKKRDSILKAVINDKTVWKELENSRDSAMNYIRGKYLQ
ncbi:precorrin-2 dehydrogenase/sirohydrochlorin ferrochelatase [Methanomicrobium sp. W14]|uniref:precorrin-2 dehydrogenase/sirohydrochlorin ferrochelatase family protein n=1 Tax=Methanomicrobium sp. W14 TaxID=2817839 RepID=UPI001AE73BCD|nr:bifunctional precorrin-2 dehydrogenase/sirohydrochlorin ferrochelatase [Methanomicrobium sp. W14]MBP2132661.1 precorrin-2 dehydrogenase/sirohydrochlorin ferrochelatase [Methanomicrobium sp. W14]